MRWPKNKQTNPREANYKKKNKTENLYPLQMIKVNFKTLGWQSISNCFGKKSSSNLLEVKINTALVQNILPSMLKIILAQNFLLYFLALGSSQKYLRQNSSTVICCQLWPQQLHSSLGNTDTALVVSDIA